MLSFLKTQDLLDQQGKREPDVHQPPTERRADVLALPCGAAGPVTPLHTLPLQTPPRCASLKHQVFLKQGFVSFYLLKSKDPRL